MNKTYMKKFFLVFAWLFLASGTVLSAIAGYSFFGIAKNKIKENQQIALLNSASDSQSNPNIPISAQKNETPEEGISGDVKGVETVVETADGRAEIVANFLERYDSPMKPHDYFGAKLVEIADRHGIDFRLLPAIAMQESNLCKAAPEGTYNCLGFGIHEGGTLGFDSYEAGFERAARELKAYYIDQGRTTPEEIMKKYTPSSDGSWASSVNQWMAEMKYDDRSKGRTHKTNADLLEYIKEATPSATPTTKVE
jgi:hypothetical protein